MSHEEQNVELQDKLNVLTAKDLASDQDVRWCPGCGDYSMLSQLQRALPEMGIRKENIAIVAGILERAEEISTTVQRTDEMGSIDVISDGRSFWREID